MAYFDNLDVPLHLVLERKRIHIAELVERQRKLQRPACRVGSSRAQGLQAVDVPQHLRLQVV